MAVVKGTSGADKLTGTTLHDLILSYGSNDTIDAGAGDDTVSGSGGDDLVFDSAGNDEVSLGTGNDIYVDGEGNDTVMAGEGDDIVGGGAGDNDFFGGKGFDTIDYSDFGSGVIVDLSKKVAVTDAGTSTVHGFEKIVGTSFADNLKGSQGTDVIMAGNGSNTVRGLGGADDLTGGSGRDKFVYKTEDVIGADASHLGVDTIHGFQANDTLDLRGMLQGVATFDAAGNSLLDDHVHIVDVVGGVMVQVKVGDTFVDVAKLEGVVGGGVQASNWAADGLIMIDAVYEVGGSDPLLFV